MDSKTIVLYFLDSLHLFYTFSMYSCKFDSSVKQFIVLLHVFKAH